MALMFFFHCDGPVPVSYKFLLFYNLFIEHIVVATW